MEGNLLGEVVGLLRIGVSAVNEFGIGFDLFVLAFLNICSDMPRLKQKAIRWIPPEGSATMDCLIWPCGPCFRSIELVLPRNVSVEEDPVNIIARAAAAMLSLPSGRRQ